MQSCLTLCQRKEGQGIKRHRRDENSCGKRHETLFHMNIFFNIYRKILRSHLGKIVEKYQLN